MLDTVRQSLYWTVDITSSKKFAKVCGLFERPIGHFVATLWSIEQLSICRIDCDASKIARIS